MYFRQFLNDESACASYLLGHTDHAERALRAEPMLVEAGGPGQTMLQRVPAGEGDDLG